MSGGAGEEEREAGAYPGFSGGAEIHQTIYQAKQARD